jgi:hypothetical protein
MEVLGRMTVWRRVAGRAYAGRPLALAAVIVCLPVPARAASASASVTGCPSTARSDPRH